MHRCASWTNYIARRKSLTIIASYFIRLKHCLHVHKIHTQKLTCGESLTVIIYISYRISFCTADKNHDKVFAFIARNSINETMECHAFYCAKNKIVSPYCSYFASIYFHI